MGEKRRCPWSGTDPLYVAYHDEEWGVPVHRDRVLFEFLVLEGAQAGLSWSTILRKRDAFRDAFELNTLSTIAELQVTSTIGGLVGSWGILQSEMYRDLATDVTNRTMLAWIEVGSSPSAGTVTVSSATTLSRLRFRPVQVSTDTAGKKVIRQGAQGTNAVTTSTMTITMNAAPQATSMVIGGAGMARDSGGCTSTQRFTKLYGAKERVLRRSYDPIFGKSCTFLNKETRQCTIYHARPLVCREFPTTVRCAYYDLLKFEKQQQGDPDVIPLVKITFKNGK